MQFAMYTKCMNVYVYLLFVFIFLIAAGLYKNPFFFQLVKLSLSFISVLVQSVRSGHGGLLTLCHILLSLWILDNAKDILWAEREGKKLCKPSVTLIGSTSLQCAVS